MPARAHAPRWARFTLPFGLYAAAQHRATTALQLLRGKRAFPPPPHFVFSAMPLLPTRPYATHIGVKRVCGIRARATPTPLPHTCVTALPASPPLVFTTFAFVDTDHCCFMRNDAPSAAPRTCYRTATYCALLPRHRALRHRLTASRACLFALTDIYSLFFLFIVDQFVRVMMFTVNRLPLPFLSDHVSCCWLYAVNRSRPSPRYLLQYHYNPLAHRRHTFFNMATPPPPRAP